MNYLFNRLSLLGFATALLLAGATMPVSAQEQPATQLQHSGSTETSETPDAAGTHLSAEKIDAYASSAAKITRIHGEMAPKIKAAADTDEKNKMFMEMQKRMMDAVEETDGITVEEYNEISKQAINNPQIASRILGEVKSRLQ